MGSGRYDIHLHGADFFWGIEILIDNTKPGDGGPAHVCFNKNRHVSRCVGRRVHNVDAGNDFHVLSDGFDLAVVFNVFDKVFQIAVIQWMGMV